MHSNYRLAAALFLAASVGMPLVAHAADTPPQSAPAAAAAVIDDSAMALLKKVETTMLGLKTYRAECWTTLTYGPREDGKVRQTRKEMATLTAAKPNLMRYDAWELVADTTAADTWKRKSDVPTYTFVCDGKSNWRQFGSSFRKDKRTDPKTLSTILEPWDGFYAPETSPYASYAHYQKEGGLLEVRSDVRETVEGTPCDKVFAHVRTPYGGKIQEYHTTWYIGVTDGLVRRKVESVTFDGKNGFTRDAILRNIQTNVPVDTRSKLFTYTPPKGVKSQEQIETERPALLAKGAAAPDFTAIDRDGKTVKLSDFRGKVVVLDFWASWCPPCVASMPHNQEVMKKLQSEGLPVVLLALDNSEERDAFSAWIAKRPELDALLFAHAPPKTAEIAGKLYHVSGIPTQYVIDPQGVIRSSTVGFGGATPELEKAIRAALSPK
jgi:peroxiredoxin